MMWNLLLSTVLVTAAPDFELQTLDGKSTTGQIEALDAGHLVLQTPTGPAEFTLGTIAALTRKVAAPAENRKSNLWVELVDQSGLAAIEYTVQGGTARITTTSGEQVELPTRAIRWVRFSATPDRDAKLAKQWEDITATKAAGDLVVVRKNGALDYLEGVLGDVDAQTCKFELEKEPIPVKRAKVEGLVYFHATAPELVEPLGQLNTVDGSRFSMRSATLASGVVKLATPGALSLSVPVADIVRLDFSLGKIAYLSDLQPETASYTPFLGFKQVPAALREYYEYRRDIGFEQSPLLLDGKAYRKGLALQSRTVLAYKLPGKFRLFKTVIGIDDSVRDGGNLHVEIRGDAKVLWQGDVRGTEPARELELEIAGVKRLEIVADFGDDLDIADRLDLGDARVTK